jgi:hypothetical protein
LNNTEVEEPTVNKGESKKFLVGTRMPTVSSKEGQNFKPLYTLTRKNASKWHLLEYKV